MVEATVSLDKMDEAVKRLQRAGVEWLGEELGRSAGKRKRVKRTRYVKR